MYMYREKDVENYSTTTATTGRRIYYNIILLCYYCTITVVIISRVGAETGVSRATPICDTDMCTGGSVYIIINVYKRGVKKIIGRAFSRPI